MDVALFQFADQTIYKVQLLTEKTAGRHFTGPRGPKESLTTVAMLQIAKASWGCGSAVCILRGTATSLVGGFNKIEKY